MPFEVEKFAANLKNLTGAAWGALDQMRFIEEHGDGQPPDEIGPLRAAVEVQITHTIKRMAISVQYALEVTGAVNLSKRLGIEVEKIKILTEERLNWVDDGYSCEAIDIIWRYADGLLAGYNNEEGEDFDRVRLGRFLCNTAYILERDKQLPANETDVKKHLLRYLQVMYEDAVNEPSLAKRGITYRADTGVRSIKTAVEYKFADSDAKMKSTMDGIIADTKNYKNHKIWKHFFAVLYMTGAFMSEEQKARWERDLPGNWKLITVVGGAGSKKAKKTEPSVSIQTNSVEKENGTYGD